MGKKMTSEGNITFQQKNNRQDICRDVASVLEYLQALGFTMVPAESGPGLAADGRKGQAAEPDAVRDDRMSLLCREVQACRKCNLHRQRIQTVCGDGSLRSRLMFIGEAPGKEEDIQGLPFVGEAGMLLTRMIERMGMKRQDVYIANIVKCRPPQNRDPEPEEAAACMSYLDRQIDIVRPEIIVTLGRIALQSLLHNPKLRISSVRGNFVDYRDIPLMPTFHPAYLLRNPSDKWQTWSDMQKVLQRLGLPGG